MIAIRRILLLLLLVFALPQRACAQVDINSADAKALAEAMTGVGLIKAEAIVAYREAHGPFKSVEELAKVKGIGAKTIEANRAAVVIVNQRDTSGGGNGRRPLAAH
ncbi:MAG: helix-hairpin-helix domain-containing protein [Dokdonella sp.]